jgi:hypothetical protein
MTGALHGARTALHKVRGRGDVAWRRQGSSLVLVDLRVPVNGVAEVLLPDGSATSSGQAPTGWLDWWRRSRLPLVRRRVARDRWPAARLSGVPRVSTGCSGVGATFAG